MLVLVDVSLSEAAQRDVTAAVEAVGGQVVFTDDVTKRPEKPTVIFGGPPLDYVLAQPQLRWLQGSWAGVDRYTMGAKPFPDHVLLSNATGVYGVAGAEHVLGMMLHFARGFPFYLANQRRGKWVRDVSYARILHGRTLVVLGLGDLGGNVAARARAFGMRIIGVKRTPGAIPGVERVVTTEALDDVLPLADHLAITLPLTPQTRGLLDARRLDLLPRGAYLYNIGRGALIDEEALVAALQAGKLAGAGLDVFTVEPLPEHHPLWQLDNVILTPHIGADTPWDYDTAAKIFIDNIPRFVAGKPLRNAVDPARGY